MSENCGSCPYPLDPHVLVAPGDPREGGLMFCPACECVMTWGVEGVSPDSCRIMPPLHVVAEYRAAIFGSGKQVEDRPFGE